MILIPTFGRGGAERQALFVGDALQSSGWVVSVLALQPPDSLLVDGLGARLDARVLTRTGSPLTQAVALCRALHELRPGVVVTFLRGATVRFLALRRMSRVARDAVWIIAVRGNTRFREILRAPASFGLLAWAMRSADRIVVNSASLGANVIAVDGSLAGKVVVVPNLVVKPPVDRGEARRALRRLVGERAPILGAVGSFQDERNHELLAEAMPSVLKHFSSAHLVVAGRDTGPWVRDVAARFRRRVAELALTERVTVLGEVEDVWSVMAGADVVLLSSKLEGSSNAASEATLLGLPVVTTPAGDANEVVGTVSEGWTASVFAARTLEALEALPAWNARAAARAVALSRERSIERIAAAWSEVAEDTLRSRFA